MAHGTSYYSTVQSEPIDSVALQRAARQEFISLLLILASLVLMIAPGFIGEPDTAEDAHRNELGIAILVLLSPPRAWCTIPARAPTSSSWRPGCG